MRARRGGRSIVAVAAVAALAGAPIVLGAAPAGAHAVIEGTEPAAGAAVETPPDEIVLSFSEPPDLSLTIVEVVDRQGAPVETGPPEAVDGSNRDVLVRTPGLGEGVYTVTWRTVSTTDGHVTSGAFAFGVGVTAGQVAPSEPGTATEAEPPSAVEVAARWGLYVGLAVLFGAAIAGLLALGPDVVARPWLLAGAWVVALVAAVVMTLEERASVGVPLGTLLRSDAGGRFLVLAIAVVVAGAAVLAVAIAPSRISLFALAATTGAAIVARAQGGHAGGSAFEVVGQSIHLAAVGTWIGGLVWLVVALRSGATPAAVRRFSNLAAGALAFVLVSGTLRAAAELGGPGWFLDPFRTGYRTALVGKLAVVALLVALGAANRFRNAPRFASLGPRPLARVVRGELALAAGVFAITGLLTGLPPTGTGDGGDGDRPEPLVATGSDFATTTRVRLEVSPGTVGPNGFVAEVTDYDTGEPVDADRVALEFVPAAHHGSGSTLELGLGDGGWTGEGTALSIEGTWHVTALVEAGARSVEVPLLVTPRAPGQRVEVSRIEGQPDLVTISLPDGVRVQAYVDPGTPGRTNQVHVTAFDPSGAELPLAGAVLEAAPPDDAPVELDLLRLGPGHFVANADLSEGTWAFHVTAETEAGGVVATSFEQRLGA